MHYWVPLSKILGTPPKPYNIKGNTITIKIIPIMDIYRKQDNKDIKKVTHK